MSCAQTKNVPAYFDGHLGTDESENFELHVAHCLVCAEVHETLREVKKHVSVDLGAHEDADLQATILQKIATGGQAKRKAPWMWSAIGFMVASATGALLIVSPAEPTKEFQARGVTTTPESWIGLQVFHGPDEDGNYSPVRDAVDEGDRLVFAVENRLASEMAYVMVVGVKDDGSVTWFHPDKPPNSDPESVAVVKSADPIELREELALPAGSRRLKIFAIFSKQALRTSEVEAAIANVLATGSLDNLRRVPIEGSGQESLMLQIN